MTMPLEEFYELLPCPFCGTSPLFRRVEDGDQIGGEYIECPQCFASSKLMFPLKDDVRGNLADAWNARHIASSALDEFSEP